MTQYKAAVVQTASVPFNAMASAEKAARLVRKAAAEGARLAVFPEVFLGGYPKGASFGTPVGMRKPEGRDDFRRYHEGAVDLAGPEIALLAEAVAETGLFVVVGCLERDGGTLYCTALFLDGEKGVVGKHRKLMPTGAERLIWGFGDGSTMPVFETSLGRIGAVICWENYMPALRLAMYDKGVSIYCAPTADDRDTWPSTVQHVALEGRCYVLSACQHITRGAFPEGYDCALGDDPDTVLMRGGSLIVNPHGQILAGPDYTPETILYADIDLGEVVRGKYDFDVVGHYARPDVFRLMVDEAPKTAVVRQGLKIMQFDMRALPKASRYKILGSCVTPRPIAWVTSLSPEGVPNAAPYSFFNVLGDAPPTIALGLLAHGEPRLKDTATNIRATGEFVVNLVSEADGEAMNLTCVDAPPEIDEIAFAGLEIAPSVKVAPPRIVTAPASFECRVLHAIETGPHQMAIIAEVLFAHIRDEFVEDAERLYIDTPGMKLLARMHGAGWYSRQTDLIQMTRPRWADIAK